MNVSKNSQAQAKNEQHEIITFNFSESKTEIQSLIHNNEPWLVAKEICDILGLSNTTKALKGLDNDEKLTLPIVRAGQKREINLINESGLYNLIFKSRKPQAKNFRKWVTSEVLPAIRKKGYYGIQKPQNDFIDARDVPFSTKEINGYNVRVINLDGVVWISVNDINKAIQSSTASVQVVKKLNAVQKLAQKVWLFGNTHPAWFTNELGAQLILASSRKLNQSKQLSLNFGGAE